jgi:predicted nucleic acid-binding protein
MIVDASVAVPWLIETPFSEAAREFSTLDLIAPRFVLTETTSALLKHYRVGQITLVGITSGVAELKRVITNLVDDEKLLLAATEIAATHNHKIYDCLYLALALERREPIATADRRLAALAESLSIETALIRPEA